MSGKTETGIYVESKPASASSAWPEGMLGKKHLYLVYQKEDGSREVIRGGSKLGFGDIKLEIGVNQSNSLDKNPSGEDRPSRKLDIPTETLAKTWELMKSDAEEIKGVGLEYDSFFPGDNVPESNSNSVIRRIIEKRGLDPRSSLPEGLGEADVPGYENNLDQDFENKKRQKENLVDPNDETRGSGPHAEGEDDDDGAEGKDEVSEAPSDDISDEDRAEALSIVMDTQSKTRDGTQPGGIVVDDTGRIDDLDDLMLKKVDDLTEAEANALGQGAWRLPMNDPKRLEIEDRRMKFYQLNYGDDPAELDETGRMVAPKPVRALPGKPTALKLPDGVSVTDGLKNVAALLTPAVKEEGKVNITRALQAGLNSLGEKLKVDGDPGPKTKSAIKKTLIQKGSGRVQEAFGVGSFGQFAENESKSGGSASGLKQTVEKKVQPLFGAAQPKIAAEAVQETLNGLNAKRAAEKNEPVPEPLKMDGDIGPKTTGAFRTALAENGADTVTKAYARNLGFTNKEEDDEDEKTRAFG